MKLFDLRPTPSTGAHWPGAACIALLVMAGCAVPPAAPPTLYQRLGGEPGVQAVVSRLITRAATDPRTARSFDGVKLTALEQSLAQQICSLAGGGCRYEGETMAHAHQGLAIRASEFDALVGLLREELDRQAVGEAPKNELLRLLAPMKRDVVAPPAAGPAHG